MPNQDAWSTLNTPEGNLALAVADGHGSKACFRSAIGAQLAVQAALEILAEPGPATDLSTRYLDDFEYEFKHSLIARWRNAVAAHLAVHPYDEAELALASGQRTQWLPYGSTLLAALATPRHVFLLQIGDGDILIVGPENRVTRAWPRDSRLLGVETTSLSTEDAVDNLRLRIEPIVPDHPALILLSTDGYANSFRDDSGFLKVGTDLLEMISQDGFDAVRNQLEGWLEEASNLGSGDDVTLGLLLRNPHAG